MRSFSYLIVLLFPFLSVHSQTTTENYVLSRTYKTPVTTAPTTFSTALHIENVTYLDGLGRPKQQIGLKQAGGTGLEDIVTHIEYDQYGREDKKNLPYPDAAGTGGFIKTDAGGKTKTYYYNNYTVDFPLMTAATSNPFSQTHFEASALNRPLEQGAPGKDWMVNTSSDLDNTVKFTYSANVANEVRRYTVTLTSTYQPTLVNPYILSSYYYPAGQLNKTITKDENWKANQPGDIRNMTTEEFKDKQGRVVLKRTYNAGAAHDTYYVYDDYGNLTYVLPPLAEGTTTSVVGNTTKLNELCYQYKYDKRNRLVEKKVPGKGWEYIVYNKLNQPILTQDEIQRGKNPKEWLFTKYDAFGRVIMTGIHTYGTTTHITQAAMQAVVDNTVYKAWEDKTSTSTNNYYTNLSYPTSATEVLTLNYYDNYTFDTTIQGLTLTSGTNIFGNLVSYNVKGLPTGSKIKVLGQNPVKWITTITHYDKKGRPLYTGSYNEFLETTDKVSMELDFTGIVKKTETYHKRGTAAITITDNFTYDHVNRLTRHTQTIGANTEVIAQNEYSKTGELIIKKVGNTITAPLQTVNYTYNIRGWLKQINDPATLGTDLFGFKINYNTVEHGGTMLFNGNIAETKWKTQSDNQLRWYRYGYDHLNRITSGTDNSPDTRYSLTSVGYDKNGNIMNLNRKGHVVASPVSTNSAHFGLMDNLTYTYTANTNKLLRVEDAGNGIYGFKNGVNITTEYTYDLNGNMTRDLNKGIGTTTTDGITYNHLNLPTQVTIGTGNIQYIYDATGVKQRKIVSSGTTTDYAGNYIYQGGILQFFNHPEGYVENNSGTYKYHYQYKDHIGNIRVSYTNNGTSTTPAVVTAEENNYYPFGLKQKGYNGIVTSTNPALKFKYNGKELDEEFELNWYDYGKRRYEPTIARWSVLDRLADDENQINMSPYAYSWNSPIVLKDPDGDCPWCVGALVGAVTDYGLQVAVNFAEGKTGVDAFTEVDKGSILVSAGAGALSGGLSVASKIKTTSKLIKLAAGEGGEAVVDATSSVANQLVKDGKIDLIDTAIDVTVGNIVGKKVGDISGNAANNSNKGQTLKRQADRAERVNRDSKPSRAQNLEKAKAAIAKHTATRTTATTVASTGLVSETIKQTKKAVENE